MLIGSIDYYTLFNSYEEALSVCHDLDENEYNIRVDPKGSGRCVIDILDEETGEVLGKL